MKRDVFGELRSVLALGASERTFESACLLLEKYGFDAGASGYLEAQFAHWPAHIRRAPLESWWWRFLEDGWLGWLSLCNHLELGTEETQTAGFVVYERLAASANLSGVDSIKLVDHDPMIGEGMQVLSKSPHLRHLRRLIVYPGAEVFTLGHVRDVLDAWYTEKLEALGFLHLVRGSEMLPAYIAAREASHHLRSLELSYTRGYDHIPVDPSDEDAMREVLNHDYEPLARSPHLHNLERLIIDGEFLTADQLGVFARQGVLQRLKAFHIDSMTLRIDGLHTLLTNLRGGSVRDLLVRCHFYDDDGESLAWGEIDFGDVESLVLDQQKLPESVLDAIFDAVSRMDSLKSIDVRSTNVGDSHLARLAMSPLRASLEKIDVGGCQLTEAAFDAFDPSWSWPSLESIRLSFNALHDAGVSVLAERLLDAPSLTSLSLNNVGATDAGVSALANSPLLSSVRSLGLGENDFGEEGWLALMNSPYLRNLKSLDFENERFSLRLMRAILGSETLASLTRIMLWGCNIEPGVIPLLATAPELEHLEGIYVSSEALTRSDFRAFATTTNRKNLRRLHLDVPRKGRSAAQSRQCCNDEIALALVDGRFPLMERLSIPTHGLNSEVLEVLIASDEIHDQERRSMRDELARRRG